MRLPDLTSWPTKPQPATLYHYTSIESLQKIVYSRQIWATHASTMNDLSEGKHAISIFREEATLWHDFRENDAPFYKAVLDALDGFCIPNLYIFSLTELEDRLSQWRGYCPKSGGVSMGIDSESLTALPGFSLLPCIYRRDVQRSIIREMLDQAAEQCRTPNSSNENLKSEASDLVASVFAIAPLLKDPSFEEEHEWRLVAFDPVESEVSFSVRNNELVPYITFVIGEPEKFFDELLIGPNIDPYTARSNVERFFESNAIHCSVSISEIPFRGW